MFLCTFNQQAKIEQMPAKNQKCCFKLFDCMLVVKSSTFTRAINAFKTIWRLPCLCHLIKEKGYFYKAGRPVFIIAINTSCSGICFAIYAWQKFFHNALGPYGTRALFGFLPGINSKTNALTVVFIPTGGFILHQIRICIQKFGRDLELHK